MLRQFAVLSALLAIFSAWAADPLDSRTLEAALQKLTWPQFRSVVEGVPKLKADVEKHGATGWKYVQATYRTHAWRKNIDKLDPQQKKQLAELTEKARTGQLPAGTQIR
jgi:hypothetical protein